MRLAFTIAANTLNPSTEGLSLRLSGQRFALQARPGWASEFPQSAYLLQEEAAAWNKTPWDLQLDLP